MSDRMMFTRKFARERAKRGGANGMVAGDRVVYDFDGRQGVATEFLQDGDAYIDFDDGSKECVKWRLLSPAWREPRPISQVRFEELAIGDSVLSAMGNPGKITGVFPQGPNGYRYARFDEIDFEWDHGGKSIMAFHMNLDKIIYLGRPRKEI